MSLRFRWALFFIALFSHVALAVTGQMPPMPFLVVPVTIFGYIRLLQGHPSGSRFLLNTAALFTLIYFLLDMTIISGDLLVAVGTLTLAFHAIKSFDIRTPADGLQVFFMAVIQLVVASELEQPVVFAVIFLLFIGSSILFTMTAYQTATLPRMPQGLILQAFKLTLLTVPLVAFLFLVLPRTTGGLFGNRDRRTATSGFDETVSIGAFEEVITSTSVVMRITLPEGNRVEPYWRGKVFETYEDNTWRNHWERGFPYWNRDQEILFHKNKPESGILQDILLIPPKSGIVFGLSEIAWIACDSRWVVQYPNGDIAVSKRQKKRIRYQVLSTGKRPRVYTNTVDVYLQLPAGLDRLTELAGTITRGIPDDAGKCRAIEQWLLANCTYSLRVPEPGPGIHPIEHFLFDGKTGYCEYYATAMVLMLRAVGIPARVVAGYHGGDYNPFGDYTIVRQSHAHTWVEAAIGIRWQRYDPTPPVANAGTGWIMAYLDMIGFAWDRYVVGFSVEDRDNIFTRISIPFKPGSPDAEKPRQVMFVVILVLILVGVVRVVYQAWKRPGRQRSKHPAGRLAVLMYRELNRKYPGRFVGGWRPGVRWMVQSNRETAERIRAFFKLYEAIRFGPGDARDRTRLQQLRQRFRIARDGIRKRKSTSL